MHFQVYSTIEDNILDCGVCAFSSSWGSGGAALHRDMTPGLCLHVVLFPGLGGAKEQMATKATLCLLSSRDASGVVAASPGLRDHPASWTCPFNQDGENLKKRKGRQGAAVVQP